MVKRLKSKSDGATRVLVADDDPILRQLVSNRLAVLNCHTFEADNGLSAWDVLRSKTIDLALVDLQMPDLDGFELIRCMRGHPRTRHLPVIVLTSRTDRAAIEEAFAAGATSFLTKPVQWGTFTNHIEFLMRLSQAANQERARAQRAEAACRVKDAVVSNAFAVGTHSADSIADITERLIGGLSPSPALEALAPRLRQIAQEARRIREALESAASLTRQLSRNVVVDDKLVELRSLIASAQARVSHLSQERGVPVCISRMPENLLAACDPSALVDALEGMIGTALRQSPSGTTVVVEIDVHEDNVLTIAVSDSGPGIPADHIAACLGDPESQEVVAALPDDLLDLAVVKAMAEAHGGALEIRSHLGDGTTTLLVLPADRVHLEEEFAA